MIYILPNSFFLQRLTGATLLVFANKQDLPGALKANEIKEVWNTFIVTKPTQQLGHAMQIFA